MIRNILALSAICLLTSLAAQKQENDPNPTYDRHTQYVIDHAELAVQEMLLYKVPASITLAQGILETGGGQSRLAEQANNHFGIKCKREWNGDRIYHDDDARGECFRKYPSVEESYRDHSKFLAERPYYKNLFKLSTQDYKGWAHGLKKAGYATNPRYAPLLINFIEKLNLYEFDALESPVDVAKVLSNLYNYSNEDLENLTVQVDEVTVEVEEEVESVVEEVVEEAKKIEVPQPRKVHPLERIKTNALGIKYVIVNHNDNLKQLAKAYSIGLDKLKDFNDIEDGEKLIDGQHLLLEKKKNKGSQKVYKAQDGDTPYLISQKTGIKLNRILRFNKYSKHQILKEGQTIKLCR